MKPLKKLYGDEQVANFGPGKFKAVRQEMIEVGWCRGTVNKNAGRVKRLFGWAVENELVPPTVYHGLLAVKGLRRGRSDASETTPTAMPM
jgi:hypothetical protein